MAENFPQLIIQTGLEEGRKFPIPQTGVLLIGRSEENQVALEDSSVSRFHAALISREGKCFLRDENSRNGTILEGQKLAAQEEVSLQHLDGFQVGIYEILYVEKSFTDADLKNKKNQPKKIKEELPDSVAEPVKTPEENVSDSASADLSAGETLEAESLMDELLADKQRVEEGVEKKPRNWLKWAFVGVFVVLLFLGLAIQGDKLKNLFRQTRAPVVVIPSDGFDDDVPLSPVDFTKSKDPQNKVKSAPEKNAQPQSSPNEVEGKTSGVKVVQANAPIRKTQEMPLVLDITTEPVGATIYLGEERLGVSPLKTQIRVQAGVSQTLYADFDLKDIRDIFRKKVTFVAKPQDDVVSLNIQAEVGTLKISRLPPRVGFYLEGFYDYDIDKSHPVKITDVNYSRPVYLPFGKYLVELRENVRVDGSENLISQIRYQREIALNAETKKVEINLSEKDLQFFPVVIKSNPTNATVKNGAETLGETPYQGLLPVGVNTLTITKEGYFEKTLTVNMSMNAPYETTVLLETSKLGELLNLAKQKIKVNLPKEAVDLLLEALKFGGSTQEKTEAYYLLGEAQMSLGNFSDAMPYLERARQESDFRERATLALAQAHYETKNQPKALTLIVDVLANLTESSLPSVKANANNLFKKISSIKSVIYVYSEPHGANVYLNDKRLEQATPLILTDLGLGTYRIEIEMPGYESYKTKSVLKLGEFLAIKVKLKKQVF